MRDVQIETMQDTGKFRTNTKDQYYTKSSVAKTCVDILLQKVPRADEYQWIEPSAGNGAFLKCIPDGYHTLGIDLDPQAERIVKGDFLQWEPTTQKKRIFFGNPPFGRQGSLAKQFLQHAAKYGEVLAFILPRSFVKPSMSRSIPLHFHCIYSKELEKDSFEVNGNSYDVPCVFQIWEKKEQQREVKEAIVEQGFAYTKASETFDFGIKRVGGKAGMALVGSSLHPQYHYFIQLEEKYRPHIQKILEDINRHIFPSNTTGPRSLSKSEINEVLNPLLASLS